MIYTGLCLAAAAFTSPTTMMPHTPAAVRTTTPAMAFDGRRAFVAGVAAAAASTAVPAFADSISDIAARNAKAAEEAAAAAAAKEAAGPEEKGNPALLVGGIVVGGTVASTAFYTKNLERLGKKIVTGKNQR